MKVSQLIELLQTMPPNAKVVTQKTFYKKLTNQYGQVTGATLEPLEYSEQFGIYDEPYPIKGWEIIIDTVVLEFEEIEQENLS